MEVQYDFDGRRNKKIGEDGIRQYVYDQTSTFLEYDENGLQVAKYDYGSDRLISQTRNTGLQYYSFDALGSVTNLSDSSGNVAASYHLDAWGQYRFPAELNASPNRFGFTGYIFDRETDLHYANARYYDSEYGRFTTQDSFLGSIDTPPSLHRYFYANVNPTRYVDPTGYAAQESELAAAARRANEARTGDPRHRAGNAGQAGQVALDTTPVAERDENAKGDGTMYENELGLDVDELADQTLGPRVPGEKRKPQGAEAVVMPEDLGFEPTGIPEVDAELRRRHEVRQAAKEVGRRGKEAGEFYWEVVMPGTELAELAAGEDVRGNKIDRVDQAGVTAGSVVVTYFGGKILVWVGGKIVRVVRRLPEDELSARGFRPPPGTRVVPQGMPDQWRIRNTRGTGGVRYFDPGNPGNAVRVMPGNPNSPYPNSRAPYVRWQRNGQALDVDGNPVPRDSPEAHIALDEFNFKPEIYQ